MSFSYAFIYLLAAVIAVPVAKRLGLGSVLGYLIAGMVIGPFCLKLVGSNTSDIMHVAEFGVVMMLFLIGLELRPAMLWQMRVSILGMGGAQLLGTAALILGIGIFVGVAWKAALAMGLILAMSSTAIVLQSLNEKGQMRTPGGQASFAVLLFQDIAVIPIIAVLPLLAAHPGSAAADAGQHGGAAVLTGWQQALVILGAVAAVVLAGRFLLRPVFRYIAATRLREIFTASALLLVVGISLLMQKVGLSPALGAFLGGVVLAESEYRHQLETDIEPFKGLLLGLFFISVGVGIDFALMSEHAGTIAMLVGAVLALKFGVLLVISKYFKLQTSHGLLFAFALAEGGEFAFVLFGFANQSGVLPETTTKLLVAVVVATMACAPLLLLLNEKLIQPRFAQQSTKRDADEIDEHDNPVILAGFGRFGHIVGRLLRANGFSITVLDHDPDQVELLRKFGQKSFYGDATRLDLLHSAGADRAKLLVIALKDEEKSLELVRTAQKHFPRMQIFARALGRQHAYELIRAGVHHVYRETLGSALDLGIDALRSLGFRAKQAHRAARIFREHDEASVREAALFTGNDDEYATLARQHMRNLEQILERDIHSREVPPDQAWDVGSAGNTGQAPR